MSLIEPPRTADCRPFGAVYVAHIGLGPGCIFDSQGSRYTADSTVSRIPVQAPDADMGLGLTRIFFS